MPFQEFRDLFEKTYSEFLEICRLKKDIDTKNDTITLVNTCIKSLNDPQMSYPIIVGNGLSRASISNIGTFPPYRFNKEHIYPMNYTVKKRFKPHVNYKKSINNKVLYICTVDNNGLSITADDGYKWSGFGLWDDFCRDLRITDEFGSVEDFMALNHPTVIQMIESIGDITSFEGYLPLNARKLINH